MRKIDQSEREMPEINLPKASPPVIAGVLTINPSRTGAFSHGPKMNPTFASRRILPLIKFALAFAATSASAADANHGEQLARRWCSSCHVVASDQKSGVIEAPPFATIARRPDFSANRVASFLLDPHPKMPDMGLSRDTAADLAAYIATLR